MGIGGYRPALPQETLARRWGDCKAKVTLFLGLLEAAGITAFPALIDAAPGGRIDPELPTPMVFNHMIAALPVGGLAVGPDDPVAGGYLFVDPTQEHGGAGWLHPVDQVCPRVARRPHRLVRTPLLPRLETVRLDLDLEVRMDGGAAGCLRFVLRGAGGASMAARIAEERPDVVEAEARRLIAGWLPGATVRSPRWVVDDRAAVPEATLSAEVQIPVLITSTEAPSQPPAGESGRAEAAGTSVVRWPAPATADHAGARPSAGSRGAPGAAAPCHGGRLAPGLPGRLVLDQADHSGVENALGAFHQSFSCSGGRLTLERRTEIHQRWFDPPQLPALAELALAEHRAAARRLRLDRLRS